MNNYRLTIQYDGSRYNGWQRLNDTDNTIEQILTDAIIKSTGEKTKLIGSGRTDAGVHALAQTANFRCRQRLDEMHFTEELNSMLPEDIRVNLTERVPLDFHSRHSAISRSYLYIIKNKKDYNIYDRNYVTYVDYDIDEKELQEILSPLVGVHNFESFRTADCGAEHAVREMQEIRVYREDEKIMVYIKANAFVKSMVRIIMGSALAVCKGIRDKDYIIKKIKNPNSLDEKLVASPKGLYLNEIVYK